MDAAGKRWMLRTLQDKWFQRGKMVAHRLPVLEVPGWSESVAFVLAHGSCATGVECLPLRPPLGLSTKGTAAPVGFTM